MHETLRKCQFYKSVFGGEFAGEISCFGDIPASDEMPQMAEADKNLVMHIELPILSGHSLMGTDAPETMGFRINFGNNIYINLEPDTREQNTAIICRFSERWYNYYGTSEHVLGVILWNLYR